MFSCLILGSGRCGTAMVAGSLAKAGYNTGGAQVWAHTLNPNGIHESPEVNQINNRLIASALGTTVDGWLQVVPTGTRFDCPPDLRQSMQTITADTPFCLKDPRFCYTLPAWRPVIGDAKFVAVFRHPAATAASLLEGSYRFGLHPQDRNVKGVMQVWQCQYRHILEGHRHTGQWLFLHYDQMLTSEGRNRLAAFLDTPVDDSFPDPTLRREPPNQHMPAGAMAIYQQLCGLAEYRPPWLLIDVDHGSADASLMALVGPGEAGSIPNLLLDVRQQRAGVRCELVIVNRTGQPLAVEGASVIQSPPAASLLEALKTGLAHCTGHLVALAMPGCRSAPNRVARALAVFEENPDQDALFSNFWLLAGNEIPSQTMNPTERPQNPPWCWSAGLVLRREALERLPLRDEPLQDLVFAGLLQPGGHSTHLQEALFWIPIEEYQASVERQQGASGGMAWDMDRQVAQVNANDTINGQIVVTIPTPSSPGAPWPGSPLDQALCLAAALGAAGHIVHIAHPHGAPIDHCAVEISFHPQGLFSAKEAGLRVLAQVHPHMLFAGDDVIHEAASPERLLRLPRHRAYLAPPAPPPPGPTPPPMVQRPYLCMVLNTADPAMIGAGTEMAARIVGPLPLFCLTPGAPPLDSSTGEQRITGTDPGIAWAILTNAAAIIHVDHLLARGICSPAALMAQRHGVPVLALVDRQGTQAGTMIEDGNTGFLRTELQELARLVPHALQLDRKRISMRTAPRLAVGVTIATRLRAWRRFEGGA